MIEVLLQGSKRKFKAACDKCATIFTYQREDCFERTYELQVATEKEYRFLKHIETPIKHEFTNTFVRCPICGNEILCESEEF